MSDEKQPILADSELPEGESEAEAEIDQDSYGLAPPPYPPVNDNQFLYQPQIGDQAKAAPTAAASSANPYSPYAAPPNSKVKAGMFYPAPRKATVYSSDGGGASASYGSTGSKASAASESRKIGTVQQDAAFNDKFVRLAFVRYVFTILVVHLLFLGGIICLFIFVAPIRRYCQWHMWPAISSMCVTLALVIVLAFLLDFRRKVPFNVVMLAIFTFFEGCMLGSFTVYFASVGVLMALAMLAVVIVAFCIFAMQTRWDFTLLIGSLIALCMVAFIFGIVCLIVQNRILDIALSSIGALAVALYMVLDMQVVLSGRHRYFVAADEYIFATLNFYPDVINLFFVLLNIICTKN